MEDYWYVLRDLARPNAKNPAFKQLQELPCMKGCVFIPMKQQVFMEFGKHVVRSIPFMSDLIFVHKSRVVLDPIIQGFELLQYRYVRGGKQFEAMTVRHDDMEKFMKAVKEHEMVEYYSYDEVSPRLYGKQIRIIGGRLSGFEGRLMSKRGSKSKRLLIDLKECNLSAAIQVEAEYIQLLKQRN
ncbi:MAG: UpxY family transcription antiterminator [Prevotella sp.]